MNLSYLTIFTTSLIGSLHCIAMCGGFVGAYCLGRQSGSKEPLGHLAYNFGRLISYTALGALAGTLGSQINLRSETAGIIQPAAILSGGVILLWGFILIARTCGISLLGTRLLTRFTTMLGARIFNLVRRLPPALLPLGVGLFTTGLPCGWLYLFAAAAASTGSAKFGAAVMFFFWLGTVPALVLAGWGITKVTGPLGKHIPLASGILMIVLGTITIFGKLDAAQLSGDANSVEHCHQ